MWCLSFVKTLSIQYYCDCRSCSLPRRLLCVRQYPLQETMNVETLRAELAGQLANIFHVVKVSGAVVCVLILSSSAVWCKVSAREWLLSVCECCVSPHSSANNKYKYCRAEWGEDPIVKCTTMWPSWPERLCWPALNIFRSHSHLHNQKIWAKYRENIQESPACYLSIYLSQVTARLTHGWAEVSGVLSH